MLFTSSLRKAVDLYDHPAAAAVAATADDTARLLAERRRKQLIRRHTCGTLKPDNASRVVALDSLNTISEDGPGLSQAEVPPPPPPFHAATTSSTSSFSNARNLDDWGTTFGSNTTPPSTLPQIPSAQNSAADDFDDEWTDDDEEQAEPTRSSNATALGNREIVRSHSAHSAERQGKVNRNINRFSNFVKSGMEAYLLGETKMSQSPSERHEIVSLNGVIQWKPIQKHYNCLVDKPKKESKLKGLKSFIAYSLVSSLTNIQVSRRYKHFDWLHEQLSAKYLLIPIPPLPEKQVAGRYEEDLIDHRKHILQLWVNKICRHPVLSQSEVWLHFISCTDEREWKNGKRRAEKDEYVGGNFMNCLTIPPPVLEISVVERQVEKFQRSVKTSEDAMRTMQERMVVFQKAFSGPVKQNWQKMGVAFKTLQQSFETDDTPSSRRLTEAFANTAAEYHEIGNLFDAHTRNDMEPVVESLFSYKGTVQNVPDILHLHRQTLQKFRDSEGRLTQAEAEKMRQRVNVANYAMLAEMNHQTSEKVDELKETMGKFLRKQADFYQEVSNKLRSLASRYD